MRKTIAIWEKGWAIGSPKMIASVYTEECIFYSTIGSNLITSSQGVKNYFEETFSSVQSATASVKTLHWVQSTDTFVTVGGMLYFDLPERKKIPARVVCFRKSLVNGLLTRIIRQSLPVVYQHESKIFR